VLVLIDSASKVPDVKFIGANAAALAPWAAALRTAPVAMTWPDANATKVIRRGDLHCVASVATCELVLERPGDVRTLEP
jgi:hypothetical protein